VLTTDLVERTFGVTVHEAHDVDGHRHLALRL
jgi:hypothetical protein